MTSRCALCCDVLLAIVDMSVVIVDDVKVCIMFDVLLTIARCRYVCYCG